MFQLEVRPPKCPLTDPHLTQRVIGPHKCTCQMYPLNGLINQSIINQSKHICIAPYVVNASEAHEGDRQITLRRN